MAAYVFACSLSIPRPGPVGEITDQELVALAVAQAMTGIALDRQFWGRSRGFCRDGLRTCPTSRSSTGVCAGWTPQMMTVQLMVVDGSPGARSG
jgi:hypothetical protein